MEGNAPATGDVGAAPRSTSLKRSTSHLPRLTVTQLPPCPKCSSSLAYSDGYQYVCPECAHEWPLTSAEGDGAESAAEPARVWRDASGNVLANGDSVTVIKDLKVKGSSNVVKVGTKVKNIRLIDGDHDIDCRIEGFGAMQLKSEFVRKSS